MVVWFAVHPCCAQSGNHHSHWNDPDKVEGVANAKSQIRSRDKDRVNIQGDAGIKGHSQGVDKGSGDQSNVGVESDGCRTVQSGGSGRTSAVQTEQSGQGGCQHQEVPASQIDWNLICVSEMLARSTIDPPTAQSKQENHP